MSTKADCAEMHQHRTARQQKKDPLNNGSRCRVKKCACRFMFPARRLSLLTSPRRDIDFVPPPPDGGKTIVSKGKTAGLQNHYGSRVDGRVKPINMDIFPLWSSFQRIVGVLRFGREMDMDFLTDSFER